MAGYQHVNNYAFGDSDHTVTPIISVEALSEKMNSNTGFDILWVDVCRIILLYCFYVVSHNNIKANIICAYIRKSQWMSPLELLTLSNSALPPNPLSNTPPFITVVSSVSLIPAVSRRS